MCELEPAFVAVPNPLVVTFMLETLSKKVKYIEENLLGEIIDCCVRWHLVIVVGTLGFEKIDQDIWSGRRCTYVCRRTALGAARVSFIQ
jgi:hypothetical protein